MRRQKQTRFPYPLKLCPICSNQMQPDPTNGVLGRKQILEVSDLTFCPKCYFREKPLTSERQTLWDITAIIRLVKTEYKKSSERKRYGKN